MSKRKSPNPLDQRLCPACATLTSRRGPCTCGYSMADGGGLPTLRKMLEMESQADWDCVNLPAVLRLVLRVARGSDGS